MSVIRYSNRANDCTVLGPGKRAVLWVHGCERDCPGCIGHRYKGEEPGTWREASAEQLATWYASLDVDGLTISGGEPMLQAGELARMVGLIREKADCGVIVYTGYVYEELLELAKGNPGIRAFLGQIDLLIDGPYVQALDDGRPYVGSSNQRLIALTPRYEQDIPAYYEQATARKIEIRLSEQGTIMMGVPAKEQATIWDRVKDLGDNHGN